MKLMIVILLHLLILTGFNPGSSNHQTGPILIAERDNKAGTISIIREGDKKPLLVQNAKPEIRPYIHPVVAPDGIGVLTEFSPAHHKHQTGIYWGLKQVNGRDYFMNWQADYWRRVSASVTKKRGQRVQWQTVYELLDEKGNVILTETQNWSMQQSDGKFLLDLEWKGEARIDVTLGKFYVGGLFVRMPWHKGVDGEVINADGKSNNEAEGQRARWNDIGIRIEGRGDKGHIAILDHPGNADTPTPWRVDNELGVGPSRQILGDWSIRKSETAVFRYRLVVYTGEFDADGIDSLWKGYVGKP